MIKILSVQGYVEFIQDGAKISYKPFLKCGTNYQNNGYEAYQ